MNYRYALIVGLLVSAHVLMGSEKKDNPLWVIRTMDEYPSYEKCKEVAAVLKAKMVDDETPHKWRISLIINNEFGEKNKDKECIHDLRQPSELIFGEKKTKRVVGLSDYCRRKKWDLDVAIGKIKTKEPKSIDPLDGSVIVVGILLLGVTGKLMKTWLTEKDWFFLRWAMVFGGSIITGIVGECSLVGGAHSIYSTIHSNKDYEAYRKEYEATQESLSKERQNWDQLEAKFKEIIKVAKK